MIEVLYLSYDGMTDPLGKSQVLPYLEKLSEHGYRFHLVSFEKEANFKKGRREIEEITQKVQIQWYPQRYHKRPPVLSTLLDLYQLSRISKKICAEHPIKIVHCRSYISSLAGLRLKKEKGLKFIFDMRGFWADERVEGRIWDLKSPLYRMIYNFFKKKERSFLVNSDAIISLTEKGKGIIRDIAGEDAFNKTTVIPCCADLEHFKPSNIDKEFQQKFLEQHNFPLGSKILSYVGSLGTWYMLQEMTEFFAEAKKRNIFSHFMVISKDNARELFTYASEIGVDRSSLIHVSADRKELPSLIALAPWSIFFIRPTFSKSGSSPTKMAEILGMNSHVITNMHVGDVDKIINEEHAGILVPGFNKTAYNKALDQLETANLPEGRQAALNCFSLNDGSEKYRKVYESLLTQTSPSA